MGHISAVIFDLGMVMVDIRPTGEKFGRFMRQIGVAPEEAFSRFWFHEEVSRLMTGKITPPEFHQRVREEYGVTLDYPEFREAWCDLFTPMPGMEALFGRVAERRRVGILSDTDPLHWACIRGLLPCLARVERPTLSFEVGFLKPHVEMYAAAVRNSGVGAGDCLFIDDRPANVDGARRYGMSALHFTSADTLAKDLGEAGVL